MNIIADRIDAIRRGLLSPDGRPTAADELYATILQGLYEEVRALHDKVASLERKSSRNEAAIT